jgi:hypothetical protein
MPRNCGAFLVQNPFIQAPMKKKVSTTTV